MELLAYDCRLYNTALENGNGLMLRDMLVKSDVPHSVEALMLEPEVVLNIAQSIVSNSCGYAQTKAAVITAYDAIKNAISQNVLSLSETEKEWLDKMKTTIDSFVETEEAIEYLQMMYGEYFRLESYGV